MESVEVGICDKCGDTYILPKDANMKEGETYTCLRCGQKYVLHIMHMWEFVFNRLKSTKM